jgi:hypothetical protein|nr:MAG TPA: Exonuclease [Caudoviricetes sp.]
MKIINVSQATETEAWLDERMGRITGTKSGGLALEHYTQTDVNKLVEYRDKALEQAKKAKTPDKANEYYSKAQSYDIKITEAEAKNKRLKVGVDFWKFLAELWAEPADGEPSMERGHRLEPENIQTTLKTLGFDPSDCVTDCGIWESDDDDRIACSPDAYENTEKPTWAIECKSLGSAYHLQTVVPWMMHTNAMRSHITNLKPELVEAIEQVLPEYTLESKATDFDFIPDQYKAQVLQYFVVCDSLEVLYFSMFDPRVVGAAHHQVIPVYRKDITEQIENHKSRQLATLHISDVLADALGVTF